MFPPAQFHNCDREFRNTWKSFTMSKYELFFDLLLFYPCIIRFVSCNVFLRTFHHLMILSTSLTLSFVLKMLIMFNWTLKTVLLEYVASNHTCTIHKFTNGGITVGHWPKKLSSRDRDHCVCSSFWQSRTSNKSDPLKLLTLGSVPPQTQRGLLARKIRSLIRVSLEPLLA
jgi:hypothetical protein